MESAKKNEEYVTVPAFERAMLSIDASFQRIEEKIASVVDIMTREFASLHEEHRAFKETIMLHDQEHTIHGRKIDGLTDRVEALEAKTK
jgi:hypothetical protein